jgi:hypothetical protein
MKVELTIKKKTGEIVTNILDREGENCSNIYRLTQTLGETTDDVQTGPECDEVHEGEVG